MTVEKNVLGETTYHIGCKFKIKNGTKPQTYFTIVSFLKAYKQIVWEKLKQSSNFIPRNETLTTTRTASVEISATLGTLVLILPVVTAALAVLLLRMRRQLKSMRLEIISMVTI